MAKILSQVQDLENEGYEFEAAEASFDLLVKKAAGLYRPKFERLAYRVNIEADGRRRAASPRRPSRCASATRMMHTVSEGDGPVNALDGALAQGAAAVLSAAGGDAAGRLQGARGERPGGHGGAGAAW